MQYVGGVATVQAMGRKSLNIDVFRYTDYRLYLRDWYQSAKQSRGSFSFREFSRRAGFQSPNFYKLVMDGERNLTEESVTRFSSGLGLNKQEEEFFRNLVFFNQAKTHQTKDYYYQRLLQSRKFKQLKPIERNQYDFYSNWYHPVIRELVTAPDFDGTPEWIANRLVPDITPAQVKKSMELLESLELIERLPNGRWQQRDTLISTGAEAGSVVLMNYHQGMLDLIKSLLPRIPAAKRDVSALTLGVARERIPELKRKIQDFRKDILKMVSTDTEAQEVVLLSFQFMPVTTLAENGDQQ